MRANIGDQMAVKKSVKSNQNGIIIGALKKRVLSLEVQLKGIARNIVAQFPELKDEFKKG